LAAAVLGRLRFLWATLAGGLVIGLVQSLLNAYFSWPNFDQSLSAYRTATPFVIATTGLLWLGRRRVITVARSGNEPRGARARGGVRPGRAETVAHRHRSRARDPGCGNHGLPARRAARLPARRERVDEDVHRRCDLRRRRGLARHPLRPRRDDLARPDRDAR